MTRKILYKLPLVILFILLYSCSANEQKPLSFAFLTDIHVQAGAESTDQLKELMLEINQANLDFVIITGDISNQGSDEELRHVEAILNTLTVPYHIIPGNHEMNWSESAGKSFSQIWGDDKFLIKAGNFIFAGINTGPFMRMGDGHVRQQDIRWLERELSQHMKPNDKLLFCSHYPLAEGLDEWYIITDILKKYSTIASFCGHGHQLRMLNFDGIPGIMGRSMVLRGENTPGYNLVTLEKDSLFVFEMIGGQQKGAPTIALPLQNPYMPTNLEVSVLPSYDINKQFPKIQEVFAYKDTTSIFTGPLLTGDSLIIYGNSEGWVKAIHTINQSIVWEQKLEGPLFATPVIADGKVIIGDAAGMVSAMQMHTGEIVWQTFTAAPIVAPAGVDGNFVYQGAGNSGMYKLHVYTGEVVWHFADTKGLIQTPPAFEGNKVVFTAWDTHVYCLDKTTGGLKWKWNNQRPAALLSPGNVVPVISNDKVFVVAPDRYMTSIDLHTGQQIWRSNRYQVRESMGISHDGSMVFAKTMNDTLISVSTKTEEMKIMWATHAGFGYDHNPVPIVNYQDMIFAATRNGLIMALNMRGELLWHHKTGNAAINFMEADQNGLLWFTTTTGKLGALRYKDN